MYYKMPAAFSSGLVEHVYYILKVAALRLLIWHLWIGLALVDRGPNHFD